MCTPPSTMTHLMLIYTVFVNCEYRKDNYCYDPMVTLPFAESLIQCILIKHSIRRKWNSILLQFVCTLGFTNSWIYYLTGKQLTIYKYTLIYVLSRVSFFKWDSIGISEIIKFRVNFNSWTLSTFSSVIK